MVNARRGRPARRNARAPTPSAGSVARDEAPEQVEVLFGLEQVPAQGGADEAQAEDASRMASSVENQFGARVNRLEEMMALILERLPAVAPAPAPVVPPRAEVQPMVVDVEERPSYLKMMEQMQRIGTRFFSGSAKPEDAGEWRSRMERNFQSLRCPSDYMVDLAIHYLEGDAHLWWKGVTARRVVEAMTWEEFVEEFNEKYFPQEALDRLEGRFLEISQGSRTVREYELEFNRLKMYAGRGFDDEKSLVRRFMKGLRAELRKHCQVMTFRTVAELVEKAALIEEDLKDEAKAMSPNPQQRKPHQPINSQKGEKQTQGQKRKWEDTSKGRHGNQGCFKCGSKDHRIANCPKGAEPRSCYYCKEVGHLKPQCPKLQQGNKSDAPPAKQAAVRPRVYSMGVETGEPSARPITGKSLHL